MMLDDYLDRVGWSGKLASDEDTLIGIHRAHITTIPFENLGMQLGRKPELSEDAFCEKLVRQRRGGWCYEMNGLLTQALGRIGFSSFRVAGALRRDVRGDETIGNHLIGLVDLGRRWVVDVGLVDGPLEPFPLEERSWREGALEFRLERTADNWWRFHNHQHDAKSFDFREEAKPLHWFQQMSETLQTEVGSPFVRFAIAGRRSESGYKVLRNLNYYHCEEGELRREIVDEKARFEILLRDVLGVDPGAETEPLWDRVNDLSRGQEIR
jgi:N-hydroxyarylamine O-acetyltransferase